MKAVPLVHPDRLDPVGALAPSGLLTSQALSPKQTPKKRLSSRVPLSRLLPLDPYEPVSTPSQGLQSASVRHFPFQGAGLSGLSAARPSRSLQTLNPRGLFFPLKGTGSVTKPDLPLFAGAADFPFGTA
jgi:hypothetical protein